MSRIIKNCYILLCLCRFIFCHLDILICFGNFWLPIYNASHIFFQVRKILFSAAYTRYFPNNIFWYSFPNNGHSYLFSFLICFLRKTIWWLSRVFFFFCLFFFQVKRGLKEFSKLPPPLGLRLTITPSLVQLREENLNGADVAITPCQEPPNKIEKLKAVHLPMCSLMIGFYKVTQFIVQLMNFACRWCMFYMNITIILFKKINFDIL